MNLNTPKLISRSRRRSRSPIPGDSYSFPSDGNSDGGDTGTCDINRNISRDMLLSYSLPTGGSRIRGAGGGKIRWTHHL